MQDGMTSTQIEFDLYITGFGEFQDVEHNPTEILVPRVATLFPPSKRSTRSQGLPTYVSCTTETSTDSVLADAIRAEGNSVVCSEESSHLSVVDATDGEALHQQTQRRRAAEDDKEWDAKEEGMDKQEDEKKTEKMRMPRRSDGMSLYRLTTSKRSASAARLLGFDILEVSAVAVSDAVQTSHRLLSSSSSCRSSISSPLPNPPPNSICPSLPCPPFLRTDSSVQHHNHREAADNPSCSPKGREDEERCFSPHSLSSAAEVTKKLRHSPALLLHLGVDCGAQCFALERFAYNEASFHVADQRGYRPMHQSISANGAALLECCLPLQNICSTLEKRGFACRVSEDPGRFVCNYIYYRSLEESLSSKVAVLFAHVPPFNRECESRQVEFLHSLLDCIGSELPFVHTNS